MAKRSTLASPLIINTDGALAVREVPKVGRRLRRPSNPFYLKYRPFHLQPFLCHPVLPGETLKNALLQARCVTDPIKNPLIGWWNEFYLFYVKLSDFEGEFDQISNMLLTNADITLAEYGSDVASYYYKTGKGGNSFVGGCMYYVAKHYFRDEEEAASGNISSDVRGMDGGYRAKVNLTNAMQSLVLDTDAPTGEDEELPGQIFPSDLPSHLSAFEAQYDQWKELQAMRMTEATFEDWLKQFGVRVPREQREELHIPELIRYVREFSYPSNTVSATDGSVASAVSWSVAERADKDRFFSEPGFIFGVTTTRPKVYLSKQTSSFSNFMNDAYAWLPAIMDDQPYTSLRKWDELAGPIGDLASDYWVDLRDFLLYGEQFVNTLGATDNNFVTLPDDNAANPDLPLNTSYASDADIDAMFVDAVGGSKYVRCDGRIDLSILSRQRDGTP